MISTAADKHLFYAEMAKLLDAGFDIRRASAVLKDTQIPASQVSILNDLIRGLDAGETITSAFGRDAKTISPLERCMIGAGERGGKLGPAFQHLADYFAMVASTRRESIKSMIHPLVILHLGVFIGIVPAALMKGDVSAGEISGSLLMTLLVLYIATFVIFIVIRSILRLAPDRPGIDRLINRLPWIGKARRNIAMARFCKVYHSCVLAGISMTETTRVASEASQSGAIREAGGCLVEVAKAGNRLGPEFLAQAAFPKTFARSYATGEEAGTLDKDLARWSKLFQDDAESSAKMVSVMVPKMLYFFILAFVVWKITGFYDSYYGNMLEQLGE